MISLTCRAYAKINLTLDVGARRPDGYHDIRSVMQTIALHDILTVTGRPETPGVCLQVLGEEAEDVPADETNLVYRAAVLLAGRESGLHIRLHKRIPSQAGLGGGSSDAAATLRAVNALFGLGLSLRHLSEIGAALGADVPFFLTGGTALVEGLGEIITPLPPLAPPWPLIIVKPPVGVSTSAAYTALDAAFDRVPGTATKAWLHGEQRLSNDFEAIALRDYPQIASVHAALHQTAESGESFMPLLCGSGAAVFCRAATPEAAMQMAEQIQAANSGSAWVTMTQGAIE